MNTGSDDRPGDPDPFPNLNWMRETMPVVSVHTASGPAWFVTPFEHVRALLTDPRVRSDGHEHGSDPESHGNLLHSDPPRHTRMRRVVAGMFTSRKVEAMAPMVTRVCEDVVGEFADRGCAELSGEFALPIPIRVIMELIGIPAHERPADADVASIFVNSVTDGDDSRAMVDAKSLARHFLEYKRHNPGDDLGTILVRAQAAGELVDLREVEGLMSLLIGAGHTTTIPFLGTAALRVLEDPSMGARVAEDRAYRRAVVDEILRFNSVVQSVVTRYAAQDIEIGGQTIRAGDRIVLSLAGANRDPSRFDDPDAFRPEPQRPTSLAFGYGGHMCLGAMLARMEGDIALDVLLRRCQGLRLEIEPVDVAWDLVVDLRWPRRLPVTFDPLRQPSG